MLGQRTLFQIVTLSSSLGLNLNFFFVSLFSCALGAAQAKMQGKKRPLLSQIAAAAAAMTQMRMKVKAKVKEVMDVKAMRPMRGIRISTRKTHVRVPVYHQLGKNEKSFGSV